MAARKRTMKEALAGEPKRALGTSVFPSAALSVAVLGAGIDTAHRVQSKVLARRERAQADEATKAKIKTRKVQSADFERFNRKLRAREGIRPR